MDAYELSLDYSTATMAEVDRVPGHFPQFGKWILETGGGGARVPDEWLKQWPSRAVAPPQDRQPTAWINASGYCVRPEVKDIVEAIAPGVHQFIPLTLEAGPTGARKQYPYFSIHVADRADDVDVEKSSVDWMKLSSGHRYWVKRINAPIALPLASIAGKHVWWNRQAHILLISGELYDRLVANGLTSGMILQRQIVVE